MVPVSTTEIRTAAEDTGTVAVAKQDSKLLNDSAASVVFIYPKSPLLGRRYVLTANPAVIGRGSECTIPNPDASVSRHHAQLSLGSDGKYRVSDLNSTNGTFVNHTQVEQHELADGDYLRFGNCIYRFLSGGNVEAMYHEEIYRLTVIDPLTGVHNRRYLIDFLTRELARAARYRRPLAVVLFDIDYFKSINDRHGHLLGDLTLQQLAEHVSQLVRQDELLARYGGEEFTVVLPEADRESAVAFAERMRTAIESETFVVGEQSIQLTVSVGVGMTTGEETVTPEMILGRADAKMYEAKRIGRNRVCA